MKTIIKFVLLLIVGVVGLFVLTNPYVPVDTSAGPPVTVENSIDIVTDTGQCWVVERAPNNLVLQSLFTSDDLDKCINWLREYHHGTD
jgi:hypothetical protein